MAPFRRANAERAQLSRVQQREIRMATMLMIVVLVFFMCNVLALVINLLEVRSRERKTSIQIPELMNVGTGCDSTGCPTMCCWTLDG